MDGSGSSWSGVRLARPCWRAEARDIGTGAQPHVDARQPSEPIEVRVPRTGDYINVYGDPNIHMATSPEVPGGKGTYASTGNYVPLITEAPPGMLTVVDMPLPRFWAPSSTASARSRWSRSAAS